MHRTIAKILFISIVAIASCKTSKNTFSNEYIKLYPIGKNDKWGYVNEQGDLLIDYKFDKVTFYHGDRAAAKYRGKFGFINRNGEFIGKPEFDSIGYFTNQIANVTKGGKKLSIDRNGKKLDEGIIIANEGPGKLNSNPLDYFQVIDKQYVLNEKEFANEQRLDPISNFEISDFTFSEVIPFSSKSMIVRKGNKYGIYVLNSIGLKEIWVDEIVPLQIEKYRNYEANYAKFRKGNKWGIVSNSGHIEIEPEFYSIEQFTGRIYLVEYKPHHWGCISLSKRYYKDESE